jgi:N-acyl-D-amino-acid deacylase
MNEHFDLLIRNATIIDGERNPRYTGDIGVRGDRIASVGRANGARADVEIDGSSKVAAPGFIDAHTHDDRLMLSGPRHGAEGEPGRHHGRRRQLRHLARADARRYATRAVPPPLDLLDSERHVVPFSEVSPITSKNCARIRRQPTASLLVGHTSLRVATMKDVRASRRLPHEIANMQAHGTRSARRRRDRRVHRAVLRAGRRRRPRR